MRSSAKTPTAPVTPAGVSRALGSVHSKRQLKTPVPPAVRADCWERSVWSTPCAWMRGERSHSACSDSCCAVEVANEKDEEGGEEDSEKEGQRESPPPSTMDRTKLRASSLGSASARSSFRHRSASPSASAWHAKCRTPVLAASLLSVSRSRASTLSSSAPPASSASPCSVKTRCGMPCDSQKRCSAGPTRCLVVTFGLRRDSTSTSRRRLSKAAVAAAGTAACGPPATVVPGAAAAAVTASPAEDEESLFLPLAEVHPGASISQHAENFSSSRSM
mmetsp:Transcript_30070/g.97888  ORF Transcript_30070/g.97888 Transcript_30070/m.97888 type:complete len:276 (-) Transcript_30070:808-1635(-)